jgi:ADP-heptose:LPS heptosyltransferase
MNWSEFKNILCIRPDNMGDLIMTAPALRALKESFGARVTILTSSMAQAIVDSIPEIDDKIIFDLPWIKSEKKAQPELFNEAVLRIKAGSFDAAIIFTVFSQNPLPTAMLAYMAGIPKVLAYCRENPYHLITDWVPDTEPYTTIKHQVQRDLDLVASIGATTQNKNLQLTVDEKCWQPVIQKLIQNGVYLNDLWIIMHPGVSEEKRQYPNERWVQAGKKLVKKGFQLLLTGAPSEKNLTDELEKRIGAGSFSIAGLFTLAEFICLIKHSPIVISVNTGTVHIAAAVATPVVVLYAQTNPQHTPWQVVNKVLYFPVPKAMRSKNEVVTYLNRILYTSPVSVPTADDILDAVDELLSSPGSPIQPFREKRNENQATEAS